jgi:hypothetical protein
MIKPPRGKREKEVSFYPNKNMDNDNTTDNILEEEPTRTTMEEVQDEQDNRDTVSRDSETGEAILIERSRQNFSFTKNELRQRNTSSTTKEEPSSSTAIMSDNYKDDVNHNGGGFYECNIWYKKTRLSFLCILSFLICLVSIQLSIPC